MVAAASRTDGGAQDLPCANVMRSIMRTAGPLCATRHESEAQEGASRDRDERVEAVSSERVGADDRGPVERSSRAELDAAGIELGERIGSRRVEGDVGRGVHDRGGLVTIDLRPRVDAQTPPGSQIALEPPSADDGDRMVGVRGVHRDSVGAGYQGRAANFVGADERADGRSAGTEDYPATTQDVRD